MTAMSQHDAPSDHAAVPQVIASYAAYLQAGTRVKPETTITGDHAELVVAKEDKTLVLIFECRRREWSLHGAEVRHEQAAAFARGKLADAVAAFLRP